MQSPTRHEEGAVAITTALILIVLVLLAAFLVDLGWTRVDARADQLLADSSVMAGALTDGSAEDQCESAVAYYAANISASATGSPNCATVFPNSWDCADPVTWPVDPPTAVYVIGSFTMEVTIPVPDDDSAMTVSDQQITGDDGDPCQRIKVSVRRTRDYVFGGAAGAGSSGESVNDAVAIRFGPGEPDTLASLIVMERDDCPGLYGNGGTRIHVVDGPTWDHDGDPATPDVPTPGVISLDTLATGSDCQPGNTPGNNADKAVKAGSSGCISATGHIYSFGILQGNEDTVYSEAQLGPCSSHSLNPRPEEGNAIGRRQIDHRFNCLSSYPPATAPDSQRYPSAEHLPPPSERHGPCEDVTQRPPFIDQLYDQLDSGDLTLLANAFTPVGLPGTTCPATDIDGVADSTPRLWILCEVGNAQFELTNIDYVVLEEPINTPNATPIVSGRSGHGGVLYFRDGGIVKAGDVNFQDLFVYIDDGFVDLGDNDNVTWDGLEFSTFDEARQGIHTECVPYAEAHEDGDPLPSDMPYPSCFAPLALWSNGTPTHELGGGGALSVQGTFFTPNATTEIFGNEGQVLDGAQFFSNVLIAKGGKSFSLTPNPLTGVPIPPPEPALIR